MFPTHNTFRLIVRENFPLGYLRHQYWARQREKQREEEQQKQLQKSRSLPNLTEANAAPPQKSKSMTNLAEAGAAPAATPPSKLPAMPVIPVKYETIDPASRARRSSVSDSHQLFIGSDNVVVEKENVEATPKETTVKTPTPWGTTDAPPTNTKFVHTQITDVTTQQDKPQGNAYSSVGTADTMSTTPTAPEPIKFPTRVSSLGAPVMGKESIEIGASRKSSGNEQKSRVKGPQNFSRPHGGLAKSKSHSQLGHHPNADNFVFPTPSPQNVALGGLLPSPAIVASSKSRLPRARSYHHIRQHADGFGFSFGPPSTPPPVYPVPPIPTTLKGTPSSGEPLPRVRPSERKSLGAATPVRPARQDDAISAHTPRTPQDAARFVSSQWDSNIPLVSSPLARASSAHSSLPLSSSPASTPTPRTPRHGLIARLKRVITPKKGFPSPVAQAASSLGMDFACCGVPGPPPAIPTTPTHGVVVHELPAFAADDTSSVYSREEDGRARHDSVNTSKGGVKEPGNPLSSPMEETKEKMDGALRCLGVDASGHKWPEVKMGVDVPAPLSVRKRT